MERFLVPPTAACVLAVAVLILVVCTCVWIFCGGEPWERFKTVLEIVTTPGE